AAEALQEIEGDAFAFEQRSRIAFDRGQRVARLATIAVMPPQDDMVEHLFEHFGPGEDQRFARDERAARQASFRYADTAGDIASADVFFKRQAYDLRHS